MYYQQALEQIGSFLSQIKSQDMNNTLEDLMTPQEITELGERIEILRQLTKGKTQRDIASDMGISVTTVSRGNRVLKYGKGTIEKYL